MLDLRAHLAETAFLVPVVILFSMVLPAQSDSLDVTPALRSTRAGTDGQMRRTAGCS